MNRFDVRYVVVGSEAVAFHGGPRYSEDFDTFVLATRANLFRVVAALEVEDLVANQRAAGRPKDLADVEALEQRGR